MRKGITKHIVLRRPPRHHDIRRCFRYHDLGLGGRDIRSMGLASHRVVLSGPMDLRGKSHLRGEILEVSDLWELGRRWARL